MYSTTTLRADLHHASRTGDRLRYPPIRPYRSVIASGRHIPDSKANLLSEKLGSGFNELNDSQVTTEMRGAIRDAVEATVTLDHYHRYENGQPRLVDVMLAANEAQRTLLELRSKDGVGLADFVHSCCRLTALVSPHSPVICTSSDETTLPCPLQHYRAEGFLNSTSLGRLLAPRPLISTNEIPHRYTATWSSSRCRAVPG